MILAPSPRIRVAAVGLAVPLLLGALVAPASAARVIVPVPPGFGGAMHSRSVVGAGGTYIVQLRGSTSSVTWGGPGPGIASAGPAAQRVAVSAVDRQIDRLAQEGGFRPTFRYHYAVQGFAARLAPADVARLRSDPSVLSVTADLPVTVAGGPVTPSGVRRVLADPADDPAPSEVDQVNVAVIDTGIGNGEVDWATMNPGLNVQGGVDCTDPGIDPLNDPQFGGTDPHDWRDTLGHGTHVAGTIGADDPAPVFGVAPGVGLWSVRVFEGVSGSMDTVICGLEWVAAANEPGGVPPMDVVNMSLQGGRPGNSHDHCTSNVDAGDPEHTAVCAVVAGGTTIVVAAGNLGKDTDTVIPAAYDEAITVAAMSDFDGLPGGLAEETCTSGAGVEHDDRFALYSDFGSAVDLIAPGSCIVSTKRGGGASGTAVMSGTSMATPHVTGAAARYIAQAIADGLPAPSPLRVRNALRAAGSFDWQTSSDPDGTADRLLDVAALTATPGILVVPLPMRADIGAGVHDVDVDVELRRPGSYSGEVALVADADGPSAGLTFSFDEPTLDGLAGVSSDLHIHVPNTTPEGDYPVTIAATGQGLAEVDVPLTVHVDRTPPVVTGPQVAFRAGVKFTDLAPIRVTWTSTDAAGTVRRNVLQRRTGNGAWQAVPLTSPTATASNRDVAPKTDLSYRVRAIDDVGNVSSWSVMPFRVGVRESTSNLITFSQHWSTRVDAAATEGSLKTSTTKDSFATATFNGTGVAWVAALGPTKESATVTVDGVHTAVQLHRSSYAHRRIVFASGALAPGPHYITITVDGGRVDVDAILVLG